MEDYSICCENVDFSYEVTRKILKNINFKTTAGESVGLIGANGAGKSTLLRVLTGLETGFSGNVFVCGDKVEKKNLTKVREKIGYVFQDSENQLFMPTVIEDIVFAPKNYGISKTQIDERVKQAMKEVGIEHLANRPTYKLSGGEKKLAAVATILSMIPEVILLDEPSVSLDPKNRRSLIRILNNINKTKIIASHDLDMIMDTCDRVILLSEGEIIYDGLADKILFNKQILEDNGLELPLSISKCGTCEK